MFIDNNLNFDWKKTFLNFRAHDTFNDAFETEQILRQFLAYQKWNCYFELQKGVKSSFHQIVLRFPWGICTFH